MKDFEIEFNQAMKRLAQKCADGSAKARNDYLRLSCIFFGCSVVIFGLGIVIAWSNLLFGLITLIMSLFFLPGGFACLRDRNKFSNEYLQLRQNILDDIEQRLG